MTDKQSRETVCAPTWADETMQIINKLTPDIKGKAFDPDWFLLRQRLETVDENQAGMTAAFKRIVNENIELTARLAAAAPAPPKGGQVSQLSEHHKVDWLKDHPTGRCSVPMWIGGCPAGFCDEPAYGPREKGQTRYGECGFIGGRREFTGYYASALACHAHGGPELPDIEFVAPAAPPADAPKPDSLTAKRLNIAFDYISRANGVSILSLDEMQAIVGRALNGEFDHD